MNTHIARLAQLAAAPSRVIIGLMSGTSLDGLDIALCAFEGSGIGTRLRLLQFSTLSYDQAFRQKLKAISFRQQADLLQVTLLHAEMGSYTAGLILSKLQEWDVAVADVDLIASHGQTIFHAPMSQHQLPVMPNATLQIGDGDHIAVKTGIITVSDFRQKHVAAGGEGAPLAHYGDYLLFSSATESRVLLNIGGISNFTFIPAGANPELVFSTDVGPGNTLMDQFIQAHYPGKYYDEDATIARSGTCNEALLSALGQHDFFQQPFPKTTGPELFNLAYLRQAQERSGQQDLSDADVLASLCAFTAWSIIVALRNSLAEQPYVVYLSGGGMHNPLLVELLNRELALPLKNTAVLGIAPDAKEAVLFALLANECVAGGATDFGHRAGVPSVTMGKISLPG